MRWEHNGFCIRKAQASDAQAYYHALFDPVDAETARLTGSETHYPEQTVISFFLRCVQEPDRHDFLIFDPEGRIVGESVINEYDASDNSANYRICLSRCRDQGVGTWAVRCACAFAFEQLHLRRLTLSVYTFNPRAKHVYEKCGFEVFGIEEDEWLMELTREKWLAFQ